MMAKKRSKTSSLEESLQNSVHSAWCIVDTDNVFNYQNVTYVINESVKQYTVLNKPKRNIDGSFNNWTNEASMSMILCVDTGEELRFFDENLLELQNESIKLSKKQV
jgi:hypothetical protein